MWYVALCMEIRYRIMYGNYVSFLFVIVTYFLFCHTYVIYVFDVVTYILVRSNYVRKLRYNYLSCLFVIITYFVLRYNYVISLFDVVTFFDDVRIMLYFGTFELRTEITLQLPFVFVRYCNVFFITSQLRYLFIRCSYVF